MLEDYDKAVKALKHELLNICWFMRGGISYTEAHMMCFSEREIINDIVKDHMDVTKETGLPFF